MSATAALADPQSDQPQDHSSGDDTLPPSLMRDQLPVVMAGDVGVARFLGLVDPIAEALYDRAGAQEHLVEPHVAPPAMIRWLAEWLGITFDSTLPVERQRQVLASAMSTFPRRGTRASLAANLGALTASTVEIEENGWIAVRRQPEAAPEPSPQVYPADLPPPDPSPDQVASALWPTSMGTVRIVVSAAVDIDDRLIAQLVDRELRADARFTIVRRHPSPERQ